MTANAGRNILRVQYEINAVPSVTTVTHIPEADFESFQAEELDFYRFREDGVDMLIDWEQVPDDNSEDGVRFQYSWSTIECYVQP